MISSSVPKILVVLMLCNEFTRLFLSNCRYHREIPPLVDDENYDTLSLHL